MQIIFSMGILEETTEMTKGFAYSNDNAPLLIETSRMPSLTLMLSRLATFSLQAHLEEQEPLPKLSHLSIMKCDLLCDCFVTLAFFCDLRYGDQTQTSQITNHKFVFVNHKHKNRYDTAPIRDRCL
jgi:hypothetical protein